MKDLFLPLLTLAVSAWGLDRARRLAGKTSQAYPVAWLLVAGSLLLHALFRVAESLVVGPMAGLHWASLGAMTFCLVSLAVGSIGLSAPGRLPRRWFGALVFLALAMGWAVAAATWPNPASSYRWIAIGSAALFLIIGGQYTWRRIWNSGRASHALPMAARITGGLLLAFGSGWSLPASRVWLQDGLTLFGASLLAYGLGRSLETPETPILPRGELAVYRLKLRRWSIFGTLIFLFGLVALLPGLPFLMGITGDVEQLVYLPEVPENVPGAYLLTEQGILPLYEWYLPLQQAPRDSPMLQQAKGLVVLVTQKVLYPPDDYQLYHMESGQRILWQAEKSDRSRTTLQPSPLPAGSFMLIVPTNGMFGGANYYYFRVRQ